jgi:hypothetical protein
VEVNNAEFEGWIMRPEIFWAMVEARAAVYNGTTTVPQGQFVFNQFRALEDGFQKRLNGYKVTTTSQVSNTRGNGSQTFILGGMWSKFVIAMFGAIEFMQSDQGLTLMQNDQVAVAWKWFIRATEQGNNPAEFVSALASYAARHVHSGWRLCGQERAKDALSPLAQRRHHFTISTLPDFSPLSDNPFSEALADNTRSPVPDQVCFRLDFPAWLTTLSARNRDIALDMARGHRTQELARKYVTSEGRVSQLRREFHAAWESFCAGRGESEAA